MLKLKLFPELTLAQFASLRAAAQDRLRFLADKHDRMGENLLRRTWDEMERAWMTASGRRQEEAAPAPVPVIAAQATRPEFDFDALPEGLSLSDKTKKYLRDQARLNGTSATSIVEEMIETAVAREINL